MPIRPTLLALLFCALPLQAEWKRITPGVDYQEFSTKPPVTYRVARVDLTRPNLKIVSSRPSDKGTTISRFADRHDAIVAINGDYFDEKLRPVGVTIGPCGEWRERASGVKRKQPTVVFGRSQGTIIAASKSVPSWGEQAVSGWPILVNDCKAFSSKELPGSDAFTRSPHPRTAIGFSRDRKTAYFVVVDGRKENSAGVTLAQLATFFRETLGACSAVNLDGGGSTAMAIDEKLVSTPVYGKERPVANHLAVIDSSSFKACEASEQVRVAVRATDVWKDVDEVLGVTGTISDDSYAATFFQNGSAVTHDGNRLSPAMIRSSTLHLTRQSDATRAVGVIAAVNGQADAVERELKKDGFSTRVLTIMPDASLSVQHVAFTHRGSATALAHTFRRALDQAGPRSEESTSPPSFSTSAVAKALGRSGVSFGGAWVTSFENVARTASWRPAVSTYDMLNSVAIGDSGTSQFAVGRVVISEARRAKLESSFRDAGFDTAAALIPGASSTSLFYFWKRGDAKTLAEEIAAQLR